MTSRIPYIPDMASAVADAMRSGASPKEIVEVATGMAVEKQPVAFKMYTRPLLAVQRDFQTIDQILNNAPVLRGTTSSDGKDLHGSRMRPSAMESMRRSILDDLTFFLNHEYKVPEDVLGRGIEAEFAERIDVKDDRTYLNLDVGVLVVPEDTNPRAMQTWRQVKAKVRHGFSIGVFMLDYVWEDEESQEDVTLSEEDAECAEFFGPPPGIIMGVNDVLMLESSCVGLPSNRQSWTRSMSWDYQIRASLKDRFEGRTMPAKPPWAKSKAYSFRTVAVQNGAPNDVRYDDAQADEAALTALQEGSDPGSGEGQPGARARGTTRAPQTLSDALEQNARHHIPVAGAGRTPPPTEYDGMTFDQIEAAAVAEFNYESVDGGGTGTAVLTHRRAWGRDALEFDDQPPRDMGGASSDEDYDEYAGTLEDDRVFGPFSDDGDVDEERASDADKKAQEARSRRYHIGVKSGGNVTKPSEWGSVPDKEWGDPVNYRYPMPDKSHADNAASRWSDASNRSGYNSAEQKIVGDRIEARQESFGEKEGDNDKDDGKKSVGSGAYTLTITEKAVREPSGFTLLRAWSERAVRDCSGRSLHPKQVDDLIALHALLTAFLAERGLIVEEEPDGEEMRELEPARPERGPLFLQIDRHAPDDVHEETALRHALDEVRREIDAARSIERELMDGLHSLTRETAQKRAEYNLYLRKVADAEEVGLGRPTQQEQEAGMRGGAVRQLSHEELVMLSPAEAMDAIRQELDA